MTLFVLMSLLSACGDTQQNAPVTILWSGGEMDPSTALYPQTYTIKNISNQPLPQGWIIYFNQLPYKFPEQPDAPLALEVISSSYYKLYPTGQYQKLEVGAELPLTVNSYYRIFKDCQAPEGAFIVTADNKVFPVEIIAQKLPLPADGEQIYKVNSDIRHTPISAYDIIPSPKNVIVSGGVSKISRTIALKYPEALEAEAAMLADNLTKYYNAKINDSASTVINLTLANAGTFGEEGYSLEINNNNINITATTNAGVFYGTQTLLSILKGGQLPYSIDNLTITDSPDFPYRGQMIDVARTYVTKESMLELIDLFASYKLNVLHFHFSDDEGWRVEIPGLPELTEIGARRGYTTDERDMIYPAYEGGPYSTEGQGSGYLTRQDFIELLQYAAKRHIKVVPEIESPGHGRAAIKAMESRYYKYIDSDKAKAEEFLLNDFEDSSVYSSAQYYTDNVMCAGLPSVYTFMEKVVDEIVSMYDQAGLQLESIHVGGDEVPDGSWTGSPICHAFMKNEKIGSFDELAEYYILRVNDMLSARGIKMAGWQELVEGRSPQFREAVKDNISAVHCWLTTGANAAVPYKLAELGYNVLLCNVTNLYLDMAYSGHPEEPGHWWGNFVDERRAFATQPFDIYASVRFDNDNNLVDISSAGKGMPQLTEAGKKNIIGVQGQLWGETIRGIEMTQYQLFPKIMGLAERGWNCDPAWTKPQNGQPTFDSAYNKFNSIVTEKELPWLDMRNVNFHLPQPGIIVKDGVLYANKTVEKAEIRYTTDGSTPTKTSVLWSEPIECNAMEVKARLFYLNKESVTTFWKTGR